MANNLNPNPNTYPGPNATNAKTLLLPEIGADGLARENPVIAYTERIIEKEQLELKKYIEENYSKIRDVERELTNLTMEAKLTSGPKKAALEHMRKKIELSTEKIRIAKLKEEEARKAWEAASQIVKDEESTKQKLCDDLNNLVMESSNAQYARLDELKKRLEALNPTRSSILPSSDTTPAQISTTQVESLVPIALEAINKSNIAETQLANNITSDTEGRAKKKNVMQGRGKGINAVPKSRGNQGPGWTGAGFDVDGRS